MENNLGSVALKFTGLQSLTSNDGFPQKYGFEWENKKGKKIGPRKFKCVEKKIRLNLVFSRHENFAFWFLRQCLGPFWFLAVNLTSSLFSMWFLRRACDYYRV